MSDLRGNKNFRLAVIIGLLIIAVILYFVI